MTNSTFGKGNAGNVTVQLSGAAVLDGINPNGIGVNSGIFSNSDQGAIGDGGTIQVTAQSLALTNGALLAASTIAQGNAGGPRDHHHTRGSHALSHNVAIGPGPVGSGNDLLC